ncbi:retrovirus-related pol polyprotein from transposon TNT 1-94 [Tanacetum coccineum]
MLADSKLPTTFWAEAFNTACYVQNRILVTKPYNKTPYELFLGRKLALGFMRPFGCPVTILNTIDHLGKFDGKAYEGFFVGYSINSKAFRVFNNRTRIVEENLHIQFSENTPNIAGSRPNWLFDIEALTKSMKYKLVVARNQSNGNADTKACDDACKARMETVPDKDYIMLPLWDCWSTFPPNECNDQEKEDNVSSTNTVNAASTNKVNAVGRKTSIELPLDPNMPKLEDYSIFDSSNDDEDVGAEADMNNFDTTIQEEPKKVIHALKDPSWIEAMQEELLQFKLQEVWTLVDLPNRKRDVVYQMDVKSAFFYGKIEEDVYVCQPPGFKDPDFPDRVYKVIFGQQEGAVHCILRSCLHGFLDVFYGRTFIFLGLQVQQSKDGIFISQNKYVGDILKKFGFTKVKTASTPIETQKPLLKDEDGEEVDVRMYRSMIGSMMYLTSSRTEFMYLKGQPKLGLWYPKYSPFDLIVYTDSDYAGASLDRKSTTGVNAARHNLLLLLKVNAAWHKLTTAVES